MPKNTGNVASIISQREDTSLQSRTSQRQWSLARCMLSHIINRGLAYAEKGIWDEAISDFGEVVRLDQSSFKAYYHRGLAYAKKGDHDKAISDYTKAIGLDPGYAKAYLNRGIAYGEKREAG